MKTPRMTRQRRIVVDYLRANPGQIAAEVDRSCRTARGGHQWMYALLDRALRVGLVARVDGKFYAVGDGA